MSYSILTLAGNGTSTYSISFTMGYLDRSEVTCQVNNAVDGSGNPVYSGLTWVSDGIVTVAGGPYTSLDSLVFRRTVSKTELIHNYTDGEIINESNLDETAEQAMMAVHELLDGRFSSSIQQDLDMGGFRIINLGEPTDPTDAARNEDAAAIADNISAITSVANDLIHINSVATDLSNVNTVAADITNVHAVGVDIASVDAVAADLTNIDAVHSNATNINAIAADLTNINSVGTNIANVNSVATDLTNINSVHSDLTNIDTVAGIAGNVTTVAGISANVTTVAGISANVTAVAGDTTNINAVASDLTNINSVASDLTNINSVHSDLTNINSVAADLTNIDACAGDLAAINAAPGYASTASAAAAAAQAAAASLANTWNYSSTTTMADPGTGTVRFNNASIASVTNIAVSALSADTGNPSLRSYINTWDDSSHNPKGLIRMEANDGDYVIFGISGGITDNTTWLEIPVTVINYNSSFTNADAIATAFTGYGNDGTGSGDTSTNTSTSVIGEAALFADTSGKLLKRSTGTGYAKLTSGVISTVSTIPNTDITGLGTLSTQSGTFSGTSSGTNTGDQTLSDATISTTDITTNNVSSTKHGFAPKSPADATQFLNGGATPGYANVKGSDLSMSDVTTNNVSTSAHGFAPKLPNDATKYLDGTGAYSVPASGVSASPITNSLGVDTSVANTSTVVGPTVAQGNTGTWFASGTITVQCSSTANGTIALKLWDGTTVISSAVFGMPTASAVYSGSVSGYIASPAANIRISVTFTGAGTATMKFNSSGNSKDCTLTAFRIA